MTAVPVLTIRFTAVNQPSGRADAERVADVPADQTTVATMFNYDYAAGCAPGHESPVGSVLTLVEPSGYARTWTLLGVITAEEDDAPFEYRELTDAEEQAEAATWD